MREIYVWKHVHILVTQYMQPCLFCKGLFSYLPSLQETSSSFLYRNSPSPPNKRNIQNKEEEALAASQFPTPLYYLAN